MAGPNFPAELGNVPYEAIIGGPLDAAIRAHADAAQTVADFILEVGFDTDGFGNNEPKMVEINYKKVTTDDDGNEHVDDVTLNIPFLLLIDVPYLSVTDVTIDFHVKLNSIHKYQQSSKFQIQTEASGKHGWLLGHVKWSVSTSYQRQQSRERRVERTYDQSVHVQAQDQDPPKGVQTLMDAISSSIREEPQSGGGS